jgi:hypothetical protein
MSSYSEKISKQKTGVYKIANFENGVERTHTIDRLEEDVSMFEREVDVLHFADTGQTLVVNVTNAEQLMDLFGEEPEGWKGKRITLFLAPYGTEGKSGIRIRPAEATITRADTPVRSRPRNSGSDMDDEIPF